MVNVDDDFELNFEGFKDDDESNIDEEDEENVFFFFRFFFPFNSVIYKKN